MFEDLGTFLIWFACTWLLVNIVEGYFEGYASHRREIEREVHKVLNEMIHQVKIEHHGDMIYWFDKDDDQFIVQGKNTEEIVAVLKDRFKDHIFVLDDKYLMVGPEFEMVDMSVANLQKIKI